MCLMSGSNISKQIKKCVCIPFKKQMIEYCKYKVLNKFIFIHASSLRLYRFGQNLVSSDHKKIEMAKAT